MDAVELPLPVDVAAAAPKLMGSEGFGRTGAPVKEVDPRPRGSDRDSLVVTHSSSIECCNSRLSENDVANMKTDFKFPSSIECLENQLCKNSSQSPHLKGEELSKSMPGAQDKNCPVTTSSVEGVSLQRKVTKANRSNSSCSKRPRIFQSEDSMIPNRIVESKDISDKLGSHLIKCSSSEKGQLPKQKSNGGKRGDKRNFKVPSAKSKFESSSMKMGASIFSSAGGGNNFFGLYGLKHDFHDVTKLIDEPPLDQLLKGTFDFPILSKDKGKKASNVSESFLDSVRKACSILQSPNPQNMAEVDCSSNIKISTCQLSSVGAVEGVGNVNKVPSCSTDAPSCQKDPCTETETTTSPLDFPLCQPKDVLERIALPPSRDLDSLLLDVSKLAITTKSSNDHRSGKQVVRRPSLPAFPWSHAFGGHSRTNSDTVKLSTSRSTCQGKWAKIGAIASSTDIDRSCFTNLDSFSYDQSLVPSTANSDNKHFSSSFANLTVRQWGSSSPVSCSKDSLVIAESEGLVDTKGKDERCAEVLAAAQILCDIATHKPRQNPDGILRWQRKASLKAMKACNLKSSEKLEEMPSKRISVIGSDLVTRSVEQIMPSKKSRLSIVENKNSGHANNVKKGTCAWPTSKSSRSISNKPVRDSIVENKRSTSTSTSILKQHCMMPPPARDLDKGYGSQQPVGKIVLMDWKRGRDKSD